MIERRLTHTVSFILNMLRSNKPEYLFTKIEWRSEVDSRVLRKFANKICIPSHKSEKFEP